MTDNDKPLTDEDFVDILTGGNPPSDEFVAAVPEDIGGGTHRGENAGDNNPDIDNTWRGESS